MDECVVSWDKGVDKDELVLFEVNYVKLSWFIVVFCDVNEIFDEELSLVLLGNLK